MTPKEFAEVCDTLGLNNADVSLITGNTMRAIQLWRIGKNRVPQSVAIILNGMAEGEIDMDWVAEQVYKFSPQVALEA